jgi:hypothetical protein
VLGFDKVDHPKEDTAPPLIVHAWVKVHDTTEWTTPGPTIKLDATSREIAVGYGAGDQLLVATAPANGRWGVGEPTVSSVDRTTGKLAKVATGLPVPRIVFALDDARSVRLPDNVKATWTGEPPAAETLEVGGKSFAVPESAAAAQSTVTVSPDGARVAFALARDPCARESGPAIYVKDVKSGQLKHLLTARSRFATRWIDATTLAYDDGDGAIRLWDATSGRELPFKLENKAGLALDVLALSNAPVCKQAPPTADTGSGGEEPPLPPEEPKP